MKLNLNKQTKYLKEKFNKKQETRSGIGERNVRRRKGRKNKIDNKNAFRINYYKNKKQKQEKKIFIEIY